MPKTYQPATIQEMLGILSEVVKEVGIATAVVGKDRVYIINRERAQQMLNQMNESGQDKCIIIINSPETAEKYNKTVC